MGPKPAPKSKSVNLKVRHHDAFGKRRKAYRAGSRDDLFSVLDDNVDVGVCFGDEDGLRADAATYVDEHRALGEIIP